MSYDDSDPRLAEFVSRLMKGNRAGWSEESLAESMDGSHRIVLANPYTDSHHLFEECLDFSTVSLNAELWRHYQRLARRDPQTAIRLLRLPADLFDRIQNATEIEIGRISARFFCSVRLRHDKLPVLEKAMAEHHDDLMPASAELRDFLSVYWLSV